MVIGMGTNAAKRELREKILSYSYNGTGKNGIWELLDEYDAQLALEHTPDELAEAAYLRGEASFYMGRYDDAVQALSRSISIEKSKRFIGLEAEAYNRLGMLFAFAGYDTIALESYLAAIESAKQNYDMQVHVVALLNVGVLYQGLNNDRKALIYYKKGYEAANSDYAKPNLQLLLLCLIQEAQIFCRMGRYEEAARMKRDIDAYYSVVSRGEFMLSREIFNVYLEEYFGTRENVREQVGKIRNFLDCDREFMQQIDFYVDFCAYLIEKEYKEEAREFLNILREKLAATEFLHLRMYIEELEVRYQQKYHGQEQYLDACVRYRAMQQEYEWMLKKFKQKNIANMGNLQEIEKQRKEFEFRSKCDLATGLFNKETFQSEVERYLQERNRNVMDALVMIDIDDFKLVNDSFGHLVGDDVILALAKLMCEVFGENSVCGRYGGDEFIVFLKNVTDMVQMESMVEEFRERFGKMGFGKQGSVHSTVSMGVSYNHGLNVPYKTMISCADEALLKAKEYGKNRVTFFEIKRGLLKYV